ncbi:hypothetical protein BDY24DRAFT_438375 [Mrakia frigida]|uniref:uncharacterized protein n=1 Tax=Mrakia frigida TaxID=29902 RepID=UPI003FCC246E
MSSVAFEPIDIPTALSTMPSNHDHERSPLLPSSLPTTESVLAIRVFDLIHSVHDDIVRNIDTALSWEQLCAPDINFSILRPLLHNYTSTKNPAIIYALLLNRIQFLRLSESDLSFTALQSSRADLCEILAIKLTRTFSSNDLELVDVLSRPWNPYQHAPASVLQDVDQEDIEEEMQNSLELAITASAKHFLSTPLLQRVIGLVHSGAIVYHLSLSSKRALLSDTYKSKKIRDQETRGRAGITDVDHGVHLYDARDAGWLDHGRLKVPFWRDFIELINFVLLFLAFIVCVKEHDLERINIYEGTFLVLAAGLILDEFAASREHGIQFYVSSLFNGFDLSFIAIVLAYVVIRIRGLTSHPPNLETAELAFDTLACGAALLFPRLAFSFVQNHVIIIALKAMMHDFVKFMAFAVICFSGFFFALSTLGSEWTSKSIIWLMAQIWFGSSCSLCFSSTRLAASTESPLSPFIRSWPDLSFQSSASFHPIFGPLLLISYAAFCSTLLLTILISILSNRFAEISQNAAEEKCFQSALSTVGGVKGDAIFSYIIPLNIPAAVILGPLSFVLTPRAFHRTNVFLIRVSTFPLLIAISLYERWKANAASQTHGRTGTAVEHIYDAIVGSSSDWVEDVFESSPFGSSLVSGQERSLDLQRSLASPPILPPRTETEPSAVGVPPKSKPLTAEPATLPTSSSSSQKIPPPAVLRRRKLADISTSPSSTSSGSNSSPLARLFGRGTVPEVIVEAPSLPVPEVNVFDEDAQRDLLRSELSEMKERMERMEMLLMSLTKGIRSDSM